jgi:hypothetical protein
MSATRIVNPMGRYDPLELQGAGVMHRACPGPERPDFLQEPSTASSGLSDTCVSSGFSYGRLVFGAEFDASSTKSS